MPLLMIELEDQSPDLLAAEYSDRLENPSIGRVRSNIAIVVTDINIALIEDIFKHYHLRCAIGIKQIWSLFPETRNEFAATIIRHTLAGPIGTSIQLKNAVDGDMLVDNMLRISDSLFFGSAGKSSITESVSIFDIDLKEFEFLREWKSSRFVDISGSRLYFLKDFSLLGADGKEILPGITYFSSKTILTSSNFNDNISKIREDQRRFPMFPDSLFIPETFSSVLMENNTENQDLYTRAVIQRLLAAAALRGRINGAIIGSLTLPQSGGYGSGIDLRDQGRRPFSDHNLPEINFIDVEDHVIQKVLSLLKNTNIDKYKSAKEDYRILAIDTIEDSRGLNSTPLMYAQHWMAIERLLPFRNETTSQLALSLCSLSRRDNRKATFDTIKKDYAIRSQIVHGYSFKKDNSIHPSFERISKIFRRLFFFSLQFEGTEALRTHLIEHVLAGEDMEVDRI